MKVSDYIVEYLINKRITDVFGYPGGMVTHLMDSFRKYSQSISSHILYHEQAASFAACGYAQASGKLGVAYATSGPGATNLITGICNAYFDSIPVLFITGQVNTFESNDHFGMRQRGFQETDIVSLVKDVTKYSERITNADDIKYMLDKAFYFALNGRKGPVLLDIPMDIFRSEISPENIKSYEAKSLKTTSIDKSKIKRLIESSDRPLFVVGNGIKNCTNYESFFTDINVPVVSSMLSVDCFADNENYFGFIGAYGNRCANFLAAKSDLIISIGARLDIRQVGSNRKMFAPNAKILRVDIDKNELEYSLHDDVNLCVDANYFIDVLQQLKHENIELFKNDKWMKVCKKISKLLNDIDKTEVKDIVHKISLFFNKNSIITADVGQNQVWAAQYINFKKGQRFFTSGGHGAMGYSLPASIGFHYGSENIVYSINGDGGVQMNIQDLLTISKNNLPVKILIFNNYALGMIRHFQEMYFEKKYFQTTNSSDFFAPNFNKIADAYNIRYFEINEFDDICSLEDCLNDKEPALIDIKLNYDTYVTPKLKFGLPNQDQEPLLDRDLYNKLMDM